jgi:hypothetical protein
MKTYTEEEIQELELYYIKWQDIDKYDLEGKTIYQIINCRWHKSSPIDEGIILRTGDNELVRIGITKLYNEGDPPKFVIKVGKIENKNDK